MENVSKYARNHLKLMTEVCNELSAIGEPVSEEDCVITF